MKLSRGDKVRILEGVFQNVTATFLFFNKDQNTITVAIDNRHVAPKDRKKFVTHIKGYIPITLLEGEWEPVDKRIIIT